MLLKTGTNSFFILLINFPSWTMKFILQNEGMK